MIWPSRIAQLSAEEAEALRLLEHEPRYIYVEACRLILEHPGALTVRAARAMARRRDTYAQTLGIELKDLSALFTPTK